MNATAQMVFKLICLFSFFVKLILAETCYTLDEQEGHCVPLHKCPKAFKAFANPLKGSETNLRQYLCKDDQELKVCCGTAANFTVSENYSISATADISRKIIDRDAFVDCDLKSFADIDLPVIIRESVCSEVESKKCLGALVNSRYVITAAQCVASNAQGLQFKVVGVRFRGKNTNSVTFGIEEITSHPFFDPVTGVNDIALLRLNQTISNDDATALCKIIHWGNVSPIGKPIFIYSGLDLPTVELRLNKTTVSTRALSKQECEEKFQQKYPHAVVTEYDLCTNHATKSTCNEFTGVPMFIKLEYYQTGFIGFSSSRTTCDDGLPHIYTNLEAYSGWLKDQMRPWPTKNEQCMTPNGETGQCWNVLHCPVLLNAFSDVTNATDAHLRGFICDRREKGELSVCCPTSSNSTIIHKKDKPKPVDVPSIFLGARFCGLQHRDDYLSSSTAIAINEFPWMALIEPSRAYTAHRCTGTLINGRYVLTTGRCVAVDKDTTIVRLGDYYRHNETSCVEDPDIHETDCTETDIYGIEDIIQHPFYIPLFSVNDIGLLRLNKTVVYSDFVRPICLPVPGTLTAKVGDTMFMSSWGTQDDRSKRGIKKRVLTRLIENEECQRQLKGQSVFNYIKHLNRICTLDYENDMEYAIANDEGGALMFATKHRWHIEGLVFQLNQGRDLPVVYVNVSRHINWIIESMKMW